MAHYKQRIKQGINLPKMLWIFLTKVQRNLQKNVVQDVTQFPDKDAPNFSNKDAIKPADLQTCLLCHKHLLCRYNLMIALQYRVPWTLGQVEDQPCQRWRPIPSNDIMSSILLWGNIYGPVLFKCTKFSIPNIAGTISIPGRWWGLADAAQAPLGTKWRHDFPPPLPT